MRSSLLLGAAAISMALALALVVRHSADTPDTPGVSPAAAPGPVPIATDSVDAGREPVRSVSTPRAPGTPAVFVAQTPPEAKPAGLPPGAYTVSPTDSGRQDVPAAPTHFSGPDGELLLFSEAGAQVKSLADEQLRVAIMEEIQHDPASFAAAMELELDEVRAVAAGERELPADWVLAAR